jgi:PAS domain S-box-containing protein
MNVAVFWAFLTLRPEGETVSAVTDPLIQATLMGEALDRGPVAVTVADEDKRFVAVNDFACRLFGYSRSEFLGLTLADLAGGPGWDGLFEELQDKRRAQGVIRAVTKDGAELALHYRAAKTSVAGMTAYVGVGWTA